jgi:protein ImuB
MSRIVSVWLPRWPIQRFLAAQAISPRTTESCKPVDPDHPLVLAIAGSGGLRIAALNEAAEQCGLVAGESLADARAKAERLQVRPIDAEADDAALRRLALWATRYTPTASPWLKEFGSPEQNGADGIFLDIEGSAHLFGGESKLIADLSARLNHFGLTARIAVAATPGTAWALSRFNRSPLFVLPSGDEAPALTVLPVEALRLSPETRTALRRLGFKTIGALMNEPRAPFAARFAVELLRRLDQALGRVDEPIVPIVAPSVYHSLHYLMEPILTVQAVVARAARLMHNLIHVLVRDDVGARALRLCLYRVDGAVETIDIGLTLPTRNVSHVTRLIALKLETLAAMEDAGFGFEAVGLAVTRAEAMPARQIELAPSNPSAGGEGSGWGQSNSAERCAALIDSLRQRLGPLRVRRFEPVASHLPERAEILPPIDGETLAPSWPASEQIRPLLLLPPEPADVTALVPDGPPRRFCWRGVTHEVKGAQGPERVASEWWRNRQPHNEIEPTRDYYLIEDDEGRRLWIYREGLYGRETTAARWFVHGLFA